MENYLHFWLLLIEKKSIRFSTFSLRRGIKKYGVEIYAVAKISDVMNYMEKEYGKTYIHLSAIQEYLKLYGSESLGVY